jgi:hypothetical protein
MADVLVDLRNGIRRKEKKNFALVSEAVINTGSR